VIDAIVTIDRRARGAGKYFGRIDNDPRKIIRPFWPIPPTLVNTAGKSQRNANGKRQRSATGKRTKNSATNTACCCKNTNPYAICSVYQIICVNIEIAGVVPCSYSGYTVNGDVNSTFQIPYCYTLTNVCNFIASFCQVAEIRSNLPDGFGRYYWAGSLNFQLTVFRSPSRKQVIDLGNPTGGLWKLHWFSSTSSFIAYNAAASVVQSELDAIGGAGTSTVTKVGSVYTVRITSNNPSFPNTITVPAGSNLLTGGTGVTVTYLPMAKVGGGSIGLCRLDSIRGACCCTGPGLGLNPPDSAIFTGGTCIQCPDRPTDPNPTFADVIAMLPQFVDEADLFSPITFTSTFTTCSGFNPTTPGTGRWGKNGTGTITLIPRSNPDSSNCVIATPDDCES
jgi:hypothetical protein